MAGFVWPENFSFEYPPGRHGISDHVMRRGADGPFAEALKAMGRCFGPASGGGGGPWRAIVGMFPADFPPQYCFDPSAPAGRSGLVDASEGGMFPWVRVDLYFPSLPGLAAVEKLRCYQVDHLWPLCRRSPELETLLVVGLAAVPVELVEADAVERIRRAEGLADDADPLED